MAKAISISAGSYSVINDGVNLGISTTSSESEHCLKRVLATQSHNSSLQAGVHEPLTTSGLQP